MITLFLFLPYTQLFPAICMFPSILPGYSLNTYQWYRFWILELDVRNTLESFRLVASDETNISNLSDAGEKLL